GVILKPYTDKKRAQDFAFEATGSAGGGYDDVPSLGYSDLSILPSEKTLQEILQGEYGIMVIMASGGDYTPEGNFATPVQMSYLTDGKRLLGRLPELNISGNLYEIFGNDFLGVSKDKALMGERALVVRMKCYR
ncbi:MAG: peptidase U62, partial [Peptococcaceae bacterium]|nr:peptidase U62 [Peptococcaceae bacterium]